MFELREVVYRFRWLLAALVCVVLGTASGSLWQLYSHSFREVADIGDVTSFDELKANFEGLADKKGARYAFEVLRRAQLPPNTDLHLLGHAVGDKLFEQEGIDGVSACTQDFRNACSHSIVVGALREEGEGALEKIREACKKAPGGPGAYTMCFHGLGHGVFSFYDFAYPETVAMCEKTGTPEYRDREAIECIGGSVMELMGGGGGHDPAGWEAARETYLKEKDPLALCLADFMPEHARAICLTYLTPQIWERAGVELGVPDPELFPKAFAYCDTIPKDKFELRGACFGGFGKEFIPLAAARDIRAVDAMSDDNLRTVVSWCEKAGVEDGVASCVAEALSSLFWGGENNPDASFRFCSLAPAGLPSRACYERLAGAIRSYIPDPAQRQTLCAKVPPLYRPICTI
ncbi:MAG: hypothetical protein KBE09_03225 [Candidatus Pacebacteria bacterium]|nr:hypothetical protein [Candidatus Paceibacterota bacterium]